MACRLADLFDVERPDAFLHARSAIERRSLGAGEIPLEGHHAGVDEQQCRIVVQQRRRRHDLVITCCEEIQEAAPNLGGFHDVFLGWMNEYRLARRLIVGDTERFAEFCFTLRHSGAEPIDELAGRLADAVRTSRQRVARALPVRLSSSTS